ncbi:Serine/threonine protein kinase involved in cellcycle control [Halanaeroarchaeum sp. HSR-CO]|uniref:serine/threonine-protein kinase Rio1 n=1 Tax=Halanaeroarchaeum sp. HSR-CO TaxID=2866382 RepID=UPI00217D6560|nr:serine/threonine-protein kinase Rio1 [Halanaeroarchaeum sp. HSR-CO]UWG48961.1 Serine/threonine protein kinase involved in cellcycle control [Halanaeroarchaeum sp. HSR-CO]
MADDDLLDDPAGPPGDEWEEIDVTDTEADRIARKRDREFSQFRERIKDAEDLKLEEGVFDEATYAAIYKLVQDGHIVAFGGPISTGKEANVYEALGPEDTDVAVKIYRINSSNFRQMRDYLEGDPRFEGIRGDKKSVVLTWTQKEYSNLKRARAAGVRVPEPIAVERNVLVMELIGEEDDHAPTLHDVAVENPETAFEVVREYMRRLYSAGLIHGDLSEYNIVVYEGELVLIDVGQAVTVHHPNAEDFLERDCRNVAAFFSRLDVDVDGDSLCTYLRENASPEGE